MDKCSYELGAIKQLSDNQFYKKVPKDLTKHHKTEVESLIIKMHENEEISDKKKTY